MPSSFPFPLSALRLPDPPQGPAPLGSDGPIRIAETHISWVLLAGGFAYKIKKPVKFDFLDFSTLDQREAACREELRLNRRTAPDLYLDVLPIVGTPDSATIDDSGSASASASGPAIEWALRMRRFPDGAGLDDVLQRGELRGDHIERLAFDVGEFQQNAEIAGESDRFGAPESVERAALDNFPPLLDWARAQGPETESRLRRLEEWTKREFAAIRETLSARKRAGKVRDGHGDLHLANLVLIDDRVLMFDCLEFNDELRKTDVIADLAFLTMDLEERGRPDFAALALNAWLERTGDFEGLAVLPFFVVYRALVRSKVEALRLAQAGSGAPVDSPRRRACLDLADRWSQPAGPALAITRGPSGSGKSFGSQRLLTHWGARTIRVRSDIERKRLPRASEPGFDLYAPETTAEVYRRLTEAAEIALKAGFRAIVDATFLRRDVREPMRSMARRLGAPFVILSFHADESTMRERIIERMRTGRDPSDAAPDVLSRQLETMTPLDEDELSFEVKAEAETDERVWLKAIDAMANTNAGSAS